jgi:hypothetical protein
MPSVAEASATATTSKADSNSGNGVKIALLSFFVLTAVLVSLVLATGYLKRKPRRRDMLAENIRWASDYQDTPPELNLMPRRRDSTSFQDYPANAHSSSTDPFSTHLAPKQVEPEEPAPQVYIGPPRDEDGHELHNVEIV